MDDMTPPAATPSAATMPVVTGADLIAWGYWPGPDFPSLIARATELAGQGRDPRAALLAERPLPVPPRHRPLRADGELPFAESLDATDPDEIENLTRVRETMRVLMRTPTVVGGAVMPDACPAGPVGTIPVGGVVAAENAIHPGCTRPTSAAR